MPLKLKILDSGEYVARGSLVVRVLQGNGIDDLVRESIQNSLDATKKGEKSIHVDFTLNTLKKETVTRQFERASAARMNDRFADEHECRLLAIRDTGTTGLTGNYDDENSKIYKLVRDIGRAQETAGAGGSWGLGKTIFYNVGPGIVGYYTQTKDENRRIQQRLIFSCIENERKLSADKRITTSPTGIAWWLGKDGKPISDSDEIDAILRSFGISPFKRNETGTVIIIPFFGQTRPLLPQNDHDPHPWEQDEASYIKLAIQRWYSNRLIDTDGKCLLTASVNSERLNRCEPVFRATQGLRRLIDEYRSHRDVTGGLSLKCSQDERGVETFDLCSDETLRTVYIKAIHIRGQLQDNQPTGWLAARLLKKSDLGMMPPSNKLSPHQYIFGSQEEVDEQLPIVAMCRGPQMIVAYDTEKWRSGLRLEDEDEFLVALYILNSKAKTKEGITLEEYIRSIENPTHSDWQDSRSPIPARIKSNVSKALKDAFFTSEDNVEASSFGEAIRSQLGEALLPPGFGKSGTAGNPGGTGGEGEGIGGSVRSSQARLAVTHVDYKSTGIILSLTIYTGTNPESKPLILSVVADSGSGKTVSKTSWENEEGLNDVPFPFSVTDFKVSELTVTPKKGKSLVIADTGEWAACEVHDNKVDLQLKNGVSKIDATMTLDANDRTVKPVLILGSEGGHS